MMRQLRKRLTFLYTVTTGSILTAVVIGILLFNAAQVQKNNLQQFKEQIFSVSSRMQFGSTITGSFLAQTEAAGLLIIQIEENQIPLLYSGSWTPATDRQLLIARGKEKAMEEMVNTTVRPVSASAVKSSVFTVYGDFSDSYYGTVLVFPTAKGFQSLTLLGLRTSSASVIRKQAPLFLLCDALGITALFIASWFFVGKSLDPVEKSREQQTRFIAAASHELRSPLAVIESSISAISADPGGQDGYLLNIRRECRRMASLVSDMLLLASTDAGSWPLCMETVDMDTLMIRTFETFEPLCKEHEIHLHLNLPEDVLPRIQADPERLTQLLAILLDNAVSYTPKGKSIEIGAFQRGEYLILEVADEGSGIPDELKGQIFDRFYRVDKSRTKKEHFGLGLSIAKELTALHGGTISVRDSRAGGCLFEVRLPIFR